MWTLPTVQLPIMSITQALAIALKLGGMANKIGP